MTHDSLHSTSTVRLIASAFADLTDLVRKEMQLARAEMAAKVSATVRASVWMAVAALLGLIALLVVVEGVIFLIASFGLALFWSCFIVAAALLVIAAIILVAAKAGLGLTPSRTIAQVQKDVRTAKGQMR